MAKAIIPALDVDVVTLLERLEHTVLRKKTKVALSTLTHALCGRTHCIESNDNIPTANAEDMARLLLSHIVTKVRIRFTRPTIIRARPWLCRRQVVLYGFDRHGPGAGLLWPVILVDKN